MILAAVDGTRELFGRFELDFVKSKSAIEADAYIGEETKDVVKTSWIFDIMTALYGDEQQMSFDIGGVWSVKLKAHDRSIRALINFKGEGIATLTCMRRTHQIHDLLSDSNSVKFRATIKSENLIQLWTFEGELKDDELIGEMITPLDVMRVSGFRLL